MFVLNLFFPRLGIAGDDAQSYFSSAFDANLFLKKKVLERGFESDLQEINYLIDYKHEEFISLFERAKFQGEFDIIYDIANRMISSSEIVDHIRSFDCLIPVPPDPARLKQRGYHLPSILCQYFSKKLNIKCVKAVYKLKHTTPQSSLNREERLSNLNGIFALNPNSIEVESLGKILLIDDVSTTGKTFFECAKVIRSGSLHNSTLSALSIASN